MTRGVFVVGSLTPQVPSVGLQALAVPFFFLQPTAGKPHCHGATSRGCSKRGCCAFGCFKVGGSAFWTLWASLVFLNLVVCGFCSLSSAFQSPTQGTTACHQALWGQSSLFKGFFPLL